jgi:hypothetical protein
LGSPARRDGPTSLSFRAAGEESQRFGRLRSSMRCSG